MSDQSHHECTPESRRKDRRLFLVYAALTVALAAGFGYSMALMKFQDNLVHIAEVHAETIKNIDARHMRTMNAQIKSLRGDLRQCLTQQKP